MQIEIYANKYDDLEHLRANIEEFIEEYYNPQRLHSAIEASSPAESRGATMVFFENKDNDRKISKGLMGKGVKYRTPSPAWRC
jgi:hypothetical protein